MLSGRRGRRFPGCSTRCSVDVLGRDFWCGRSRSKARSLHVKKQFQINSTWTQAVKYSRGPFMAAMFVLVFWILFSGHDESGLSPNTKVFGCWMSCWRSFGAAEFLTPVCVDWLFWLLAFGAGGCLFWTDVVDTLPGSGLVGWCLESVFFANTNTARIFIPHPLSIWE